MLTSHLEVIVTMLYASPSHSYQVLKEVFQVPDLQWVIAAVPYGHILF